MSDGWIGPLAAIVVETLGALVVVWQFGAQARKAIEQNRINEGLKLKLRVYEEILQGCSAAIDAETSLSNLVLMFQTDVEAAHQFPPPNGVYRTPAARMPAYLEADRRFSDATIDVVLLTERWQIIDPRIDLFRFALLSAMHGHREASAAYFPFAMDAMPLELPGPPGQPPQLRVWTPPDLHRTQALSTALFDAVKTCESYVADMQVEMQNLLVGGLFESRIAPREPLDPKYVALRLDRYEQLKAHFENDTPWGQSNKRIIENERRRLVVENGNSA